MARMFLLLSLLEEAHALDNYEMRRQAYEIRALSLLTRDDDYVKVYRLNKELIDKLELELLPYIKCTKRRGKGLSTRIKILCTLSFLANGSYQKIIKENVRTYLSQPSASRCIEEVVDALNKPNIVQKYIRFPQNVQERQILKERFYEKFKVPAVIGCIDGTLVALKRPAENEERFYCRKGYHARNVQLITDADLNILHVDATHGGATHDSLIFNYSIIKDYLEEVTNSGEEAILLGDYKNAIYWLEKHVSQSPDARGKYLLKQEEERLNRNKPVKKKRSGKGPFYVKGFTEFCRGPVGKNDGKNKSLTCHYAHGPHPFLMLAPVKAEVLHRDPDIIMYYDVISDEKSQDLIRMVKPKLGPKAISGFHPISENDTTSVNHLFRPDDSYPESAATSRIAHILTGHIVSSKLGGSSTSYNYSANIQVINYGIGGFIEPHFDILTCDEPYPDERLTTVLFYLSSIDQGGATVFPHIGLTIYPVKNAALYWMNVDAWGRNIYETYHGACPIMRGSKWVGTKWIHGKGQLHICPTHPPTFVKNYDFCKSNRESQGLYASRFAHYFNKNKFNI